MMYDELLSCPIGSCVLESARRYLVKDRMEQTGMRWQAHKRRLLTTRTTQPDATSRLQPEETIIP